MQLHEDNCSCFRASTEMSRTEQDEEDWWPLSGGSGIAEPIVTKPTPAPAATPETQVVNGIKTLIGPTFSDAESQRWIKMGLDYLFPPSVAAATAVTTAPQIPVISPTLPKPADVMPVSVPSHVWLVSYLPMVILVFMWVRWFREKIKSEVCVFLACAFVVACLGIVAKVAVT